MIKMKSKQVLLCIAILSVLILIEVTVSADEVKVQKAIESLLSKAPGRALTRDKQRQAQLANDIVEASGEYDVPSLLLTMIVFRESSFKTNVTGKIGEYGLVQVHGLAAKNCDLSTQVGQLRCGARWLKKSYNMCGTWKKALIAYATGKCKSGSKRVAVLIKSRMELWKKLEEIGTTND